MSATDPLRARAAVRDRIAAAAARSGRDPASVALVAVSKTVPPERIPDAPGDDPWVLGENRVQEFVAKREVMAGRTPPVHWHFVGALQRNKAARVVGAVELIHGVDSVRLGEAIARRARALGVIQEVLLEVNTSGEPTKHGVAPAEAVETATALAAVEGIALRGFMTMAPAGDPQGARTCFARLRAIRDEVRGPTPRAVELSMGMTGDFEVAVEEGATIVRIGTAIFGPRPPDR